MGNKPEATAIAVLPGRIGSTTRTPGPNLNKYKYLPIGIEVFKSCSQGWFKGFETQLDQVMKQMQEKPATTPPSGTLSTLVFDQATGAVAQLGSFSSATAGSATSNALDASLPLKQDAKK